ncbi:hypothetical protein [Phycicoccus avicenniae]|uniref:hypothetical protein n=1 Tax=Phycicoccus avicenniae TaxID=2828860 RepID=UPI003D277119
MSTRTGFVAGVALTAPALWVGGWAELAPRSFYDSFPGFGRVWVSTDGPFNEHLVRDVGGLYLALAAAGLLALAWRDRRTLLLLGTSWLVFGLLHVGYHVAHLDTLASTADRVGEVVSLGIVPVLAVVLLLAERTDPGPVPPT